MAQSIRLKQKLKTVFLSSLGGGLEFYDFVIFAIFAKTIGENFFPSSSPIANLIHSYGLFAIGYLIRPLGGILFSHYGDKYGRKKSFAFSISLMSLATILMSITPNYSQWGIWATFIFIFFRLLQGISIGGEIPGAITFISEHVPAQKGAACAVILIFLNAGILLGSLVQVILHSLLNESNFHYYGWRLAFFIGGVLALISFYMRRSLKETTSFLEEKIKHKIPLKVLIKEYSQTVIKAIAIVGGSACVTSIYLLFINSYLQTVIKLPAKIASSISLHQLLVFMLFSSLTSYLSDLTSLRKILVAGACYLIFSPFIVFKLLNTSSYIELVLCINAALIAMFAGTLFSYLSELFPVSIRYSGIALSYNVGFAVFGGLSPFISTILISNYNWPSAPALVIAISGVLSLASLKKVGCRKNEN